jgi:tetratricopeptide (TPR) repeat protein
MKRWAQATALSTVAVSLVLVILSPTNGLAQEAEPIDEPSRETASESTGSSAERRMIALNEAGFSAFAEGKFVEAAQKFEEAHTYLPDPILRKNAAIAWFKAGRCVEASEAAVFFLLADEMTARDRVEARSVLGHCRLEQAEAALEEGDVERAVAIIERVAFLETDERVDERLAAVRMQVVEAGAGEPDAFSSTETAGWVMVASGAAILAGNVGYLVVSESCQDASDKADWLVPTLYGVGGVTVGSGLWIALSADSPQRDVQDQQETQKPAALRAPASGMHLNLSVKF